MLNILLLIANAWAGEWQSLGVTNNVAVYRKQEEGTGLYAFKGEATSDLPIGQLMGILRDETVAKEWVNMMMFGTVVETYSENHMLLHQGYDLPWPLSDRDYVFDKKVVYDAKTKTIYISEIGNGKVLGFENCWDIEGNVSPSWSEDLAGSSSMYLYNN